MIDLKKCAPFSVKLLRPWGARHFLPGDIEVVKVDGDLTKVKLVHLQDLHWEGRMCIEHWEVVRTVNEEKQRKARKRLISCFMDAKGRGK